MNQAPFEAILFRGKQCASHDTYEDELENMGCKSTTFIPVLTFDYPTEEMHSKISTILSSSHCNATYSAIVLTSAQAVKGCTQSLIYHFSQSEKNDSKSNSDEKESTETRILRFLREIEVPVFCVGEATCRAARAAGFVTAQAPAKEGHAEVLFKYMRYYLARISALADSSESTAERASIFQMIPSLDSTQLDNPLEILSPGKIKPVLLLNTEGRLNVLPDHLTDLGVPFEEARVYRSVPRRAEEISSDIFEAFCAPNIRDSKRPVIFGFFSPSGFKAVLGAIRTFANDGTLGTIVQDTLDRVTAVSIGSTTSQAIQDSMANKQDSPELWLSRPFQCDSVAQCPTPRDFAQASAASALQYYKILRSM